MAKEFHRSERVGEELRRVLAEAIRDELDDPRLKLVTLTAIRVSRDLGHAKVWFSSLDDSDPAAIASSLERAAGFLRGVAGRKLVIRTVPELKFVFDDSLERGQKLREIIDEAVDSDRRRSEPPGEDD